MDTQTDQFNEHAHGAELANRDQIDAEGVGFAAPIALAVGLPASVALIVARLLGWI